MPYKIIEKRELTPPIKLIGRMKFHKPLKGIALITGGEGDG